MAKFRFKVNDQAGKTKSGQVTCPDRETAESRLRKAGYTILELEDVGSEIEVVEGAKKERPKIERAPSRGYRPGFADFFDRLNVNPDRRNISLYAIALLGLAVAIFHGVGERRKVEAQVAKQPKYEKVSLAVKGRVNGVTEPEGVKVVFHFPEIPLDLERSAAELLGDDGTFEMKYDFESQRVPTYVTLTVRNGKKDPIKLERQMLQGEPKTAQFKPVNLQL